MDILIHPGVSYDTIVVQQKDGLDLLRSIPFIRKFVVYNVRPTITCVGRKQISNMVVTSETRLPLGEKFDLSEGDRTYLGVMPIVFTPPNLYECTVDHIEERT